MVRFRLSLWADMINLLRAWHYWRATAHMKRAVHHMASAKASGRLAYHMLKASEIMESEIKERRW